MKEIIQGFYQKKHFWTRLILVIAAVILMGFALSWLLLVDLGTDPPRHQHRKLAGALQYRPAHLRYHFRRQKLRLRNPRKHVSRGIFHRLFLLDLGESPSGRPLHLDGCANRRADPGADPVYPCRILLYGC